MTQKLILVFVASSLSVAFAQQGPAKIPIINPFFTQDQLSCSPGNNYCYSAGSTGWLCGPNTNVQKFSTAQFTIAPPQGLYVAAIGNSSSTGSVLQTLGDTLHANTTYVLTVAIGARADYPFTGYEAALMAGNVVVASGNKATPVGGGFATDVIIYSSGPAPAQMGKPLQIIVKSLGTGQVDVTAVTLTAE